MSAQICLAKDLPILETCPLHIHPWPLLQKQTVYKAEEIDCWFAVQAIAHDTAPLADNASQSCYSAAKQDSMQLNTKLSPATAPKFDRKPKAGGAEVSEQTTPPDPDILAVSSNYDIHIAINEGAWCLHVYHSCKTIWVWLRI